MGPSFSLWLYLTRARLEEGDAPDLSAPCDRPDGPLVWAHCPTPEDAGKLSELTRLMGDAAPAPSFLVTHPPGQPAPGMGPRCIVMPLPADGPVSARVFLDHWRPDLAVFFDGGLPPAMIAEAHQRRVPLALLAAARPEHGLPGGALRARLTAAVLGRFNRIFAARPELADAYRRLARGSGSIVLSGPLADGTRALPVNAAEHDAMTSQLAGRPSWLAIDATRSEIPIVLAAHARALREAHRLLLFLVPDEPDTGPGLAASLRAEGWKVALRSAEEDPQEDTTVYIADQPGERGLWFRLAPVSFLGRSHGAGTPCDPFEAAALGSAILHGPATGAQAARFARLARAGAARKVSDARDLGTALTELISPERAAEMAHAGWETCSHGAEASAEVAAALAALLPAPEVS